MQKARRHPDNSRLRPLVSAWFQVLFTPLPGVLFTFPSQYWFTIGLLVVFSLTGWCRQIQAGFLRSRPTQDTLTHINLAYTGLSPPSVQLSSCVLVQFILILGSYNPALIAQYGLGSSAFARHYSRNHYYFLLLRVLRCFSSPRFTPV
jgi:hypothetical protein